MARPAKAHGAIWLCLAVASIILLYLYYVVFCLYARARGVPSRGGDLKYVQQIGHTTKSRIWAMDHGLLHVGIVAIDVKDLKVGFM